MIFVLGTLSFPAVSCPSEVLSRIGDAMNEGLQMPAVEPSGFVPTLNRMGYMTSTLDPYSKAFIEFSTVAPGPVLDVGAAYGVATIEALKNSKRVFANDIDSRHLEILRDRVPAELRDRLELFPGAFPEGLSFERESLGAILVARVMHFFDGATIDRSAETLHRWLAPGGKAFIVAETPYLKNWQTFIPEYEKRRAQGELWPGFVSDVMAFAPDRGKSLPPQIHFLDPDVLSRVFIAAGFKIEKVGTMPRPDFPADMQLDGRESVGIIAVKAE